MNVKTALVALLNADYKLVIVTNQSGIARGYYSEKDFHILTDAMTADLNKSRITVLDVLYCPHHPNGVIDKFATICNCRKPKPGLILSASKKHNISLRQSVMFGDKVTDLQAAKDAGVSNRFLVNDKKETDISLCIFNNLQTAVERFLSLSYSL